MHFLDMNIHFPKMKRVFSRFLLWSLALAGLIFIVDIFVVDYKLLRFFFINIYTPFLIIITLFAFYFAYKTPKKLGHFIITGILLYNIFAYLSLYKSIFYREFESIKYFYIGILLESLVFMFGLGYKIKLIYAEKINSQNKIILEQKQNQLLKEKYRLELEYKLNKQAQELNRTQQKAEKEKIDFMKIEFENQIKDLHLASLQSQMNPHFIFNALNSIKVFLIENNKEKAVYYLNKFSKLIRKILESSRVESHSLEEELEIIALYLSIENIRFEEAISFSIKKNPDVVISKIKVPPLILQPFVENAIWHGLMLSKNKKRIEIEVFSEDNVTKLSIKDNGIGRKKSLLLNKKKTVKKNSVGLKMSEERIAYFNQKHQLKNNFQILDIEDKKGNALGTEILFSFQ